MPTITYFEQERRDGGTRVGIDVDGDTVRSAFRSGSTDSDPALVWYVDVACAGPKLPRDPDRALKWLSVNARHIGRVLTVLAKALPAGIDSAAWPVRRRSKIGPAVTVTISCSAARRVNAQQIASTLMDIAEHLRERLDSLSEVKV
jgi:hypothetical protein